MSKIKSHNQFKKEGDNILMELNNTKQWVIIDKEDLLSLKLHTWSIYCIKSYRYIVTSINTKQEDGKYKTEKISLSRYLLNAPNKKQVRHLNGNFLDCRRSNIKVV